MSKTNELDNVILLKGTFLVDINKEETKSESGLVLSSQRTQKVGTIVRSNRLDTEGKEVDYEVGDRVILNPNRVGDATKVTLDGHSYNLCTRDDIWLILERTEKK